MSLRRLLHSILASALFLGCGVEWNGDETTAVVKDGLAPYCGDGIIQWLEECDDGNPTAGDGCDECLVECGPAPELLDQDSKHCFRFFGGQPGTTWEGAQTTCASWGGSLATFTSVDEFIAVQNRITVSTWIGAHALDDGSFDWVTDEPWTFETWVDHEFGAGDCVVIDDRGLAFRTQPCTDHHAYVCERAPAGVREE